MSLTEKSFWPRGLKQKNNEKKVYNRWLFRKTNMFFIKYFYIYFDNTFFQEKSNLQNANSQKYIFFILTRANMKGESSKLRAPSENQRYFSNFLQMKLSFHKPFIKTLNNDNTFCKLAKLSLDIV